MIGRENGALLQIGCAEKVSRQSCRQRTQIGHQALVAGVQSQMESQRLATVKCLTTFAVGIWNGEAFDLVSRRNRIEWNTYRQAYCGLGDVSGVLIVTMPLLF